jgi:MFS family permease
MALLADFIPPKDRGLAFGVFGTAIDLGISAGNFAVGGLAAAFGYGAGFLMAAGIAAASLPVLFSQRMPVAAPSPAAANQ